ncbi:MAG: response regulator [Acidobacteriaceae bacterium]|nr:response regulator [Acidobacteriaceae bacterium]
MPPGKSILLVDDDPVTHDLVRAMLAREPHHIEGVFSGEEALEKLLDGEYDLVLSDIRMPGMDGLTLLNKIHEERPGTKVVVMTAESTPAKVVRAIHEKAFNYLSKPFSRDALIETVNAALDSVVAHDDIEVVSARPDWISLQLRCKLATADRLSQFFRELNADLGPDERDSVSTAFRELLMNAIEHGGKADPNQRVYVTYVRTARCIVYYIRDPGEGFSFENLPHAAVSNTPEQPFEHAAIRNQLGIRPGGFGILLTRNFADELVYSAKGNEVMLIKYLNHA